MDLTASGFPAASRGRGREGKVTVGAAGIASLDKNMRHRVTPRRYIATFVLVAGALERGRDAVAGFAPRHLCGIHSPTGRHAHLSHGPTILARQLPGLAGLELSQRQWSHRTRRRRGDQLAHEMTGDALAARLRQRVGGVARPHPQRGVGSMGVHLSACCLNPDFCWNHDGGLVDTQGDPV